MLILGYFNSNSLYLQSPNHINFYASSTEFVNYGYNRQDGIEDFVKSYWVEFTGTAGVGGTAGRCWDWAIALYFIFPPPHPPIEETWNSPGVSYKT